MSFSNLVRVCLITLFIITHGHAADYFIAPNGSDSGNGTQVVPFATFDKAQDAIRQSRQLHPEEASTLWLAGGKYILEKPIGITDSGSADSPISYRAIDGQTPELTNSRHLSASDFLPVTDPATLARIADSAKGKIVMIDLKALGVQHLSSPPNVFADTGGMPDLFFNGQRMSLSRYPKQGFMKIKSVISNGDAQGSPSVFEYREEDYPEFAKWAKSGNAILWLKGYWRVMWQNEAARVRKIDTDLHTVTFEQSVPGGIGSKYHRPRGDGKEQYWLFNLLEEITQPGEWSIDYEAGKLYFYPPDSLDKAQVLLADNQDPLLEITNASHIIVRGITFEYCLGNAISIKGGDGDLVAGCTVRNSDDYGIRIDGGSNHTVLSCDLYHLGRGGIWLAGGDDSVSPRIPSGHKVLNNHIYDFSEIVKVYTPAVNCGYAGGNDHYSCVGVLVAHNLIHDTPHGGILYGSWDNVFEYNEIFRYCLTSNDLGAFYSYSRFDHMGNETIRYNFIHGTAQGDGIYFDFDHRDMHCYGNIIYLQGNGAGYLYKVGTQATSGSNSRPGGPPMSNPANAQPLDCHDNIVIQCKRGYTFIVPENLFSNIRNNVAVDCETPWTYDVINDGKVKKASDELLQSSNKFYTGDPGFVDLSHLNFNLKPDSQILKDLPSFKMMPLTKVGLYVDEYRKILPTDDEVDRLSEHTSMGGSVYKVEDRKN